LLFVIRRNQPAFWIGKESLRSWKKMVLERMVNSERESMKVKNGVDSATNQIEEATISDLPITSKHKVDYPSFKKADQMCDITPFVTRWKESEATASIMGAVRLFRNVLIGNRIEASGKLSLKKRWNGKTGPRLRLR
jgi:hypothetical protein